MLIDDYVVPPRSRRGRRPELTGIELRAMFPVMLQQSGYHTRLKNARPLLCKTIQILAMSCPSWFDDM